MLIYPVPFLGAEFGDTAAGPDDDTEDDHGAEDEGGEDEDPGLGPDSVQPVARVQPVQPRGRAAEAAVTRGQV